MKVFRLDPAEELKFQQQVALGLWNSGGTAAIGRSSVLAALSV